MFPSMAIALSVTLEPMIVCWMIHCARMTIVAELIAETIVPIGADTA